MQSAAVLFRDLQELLLAVFIGFAFINVQDSARDG